MTPNSTDASNRPEALRTPRFHYGIGAGCFLFLIGGALGLVALVASGDSERKAFAAWAFIGAAIGLLIILVFGGIGTTRTRRRLADLQWAPTPGPDGPEAVRALEAQRFVATTRLRTFPTRPVVDTLVGDPQSPTRLLINIPPVMRARKKGDRMEPATAYQWRWLPKPLPVLVVSPDTGGDGVVLRDIDIESDAFNQRYRISGAMSAPRPELARYATMMLHPRAAETLIDLPQATTLVISGRVAGCIGMVDTDRRRYEIVADVLTRFVGQIPPLVWSQYADVEGYRPR